MPETKNKSRLSHAHSDTLTSSFEAAEVAEERQEEKKALESMCLLAQNSRREFLAPHRASREVVAEPALVLSAASQQTDSFVTHSGAAGRGLSGMVLSTIPDKKYHSLFKSFLCALCGLEGAERLGVR